MTKIIAFTLCGTYPSWTDYAIGSVYNSVDKIIVVNSGYDIFNPGKGCNIEEPVNKARIHDIMKLDTEKKILYIGGLDHIKHDLEIDFTKHEYGRSGNATYANRLARELGADWILHFASDQIFYNLSREKLEILTNYPHDGYRFWQYADLIYDLKYHAELPGNGTNDGSLFYESKPGQYYVGQGAPNTNTEQFEIENIQTAHMRNAVPFGLQPYEYYYSRFWYHWYAPNVISEHSYNEAGNKYTEQEIQSMAHTSVVSILNNIKTKHGLYKLGELQDNRAPKDIPGILKIGISKYISKPAQPKTIKSIKSILDREKLQCIFDTYKPVQNIDEFSWLIDKVQKLNPRIILEIGVENGGTFKIWEQLLPLDGLLIGIDTVNNIKWDIKSSSRRIEFILNSSTSKDTIDKVRTILRDRKIDFIFIDGSHDYYDVKSDYENYKQFVRPGGMIGFHDIYAQAKGAPINLNDGLHGSVTRFWIEVEANQLEFQSPTGFNMGVGLIKL